MKKVLILLLLSILLFMLDNVLMPFISIRGAYPNLLLVFIISYSIINGSWEGMWIGTLCGMLQDVYFLNGFGINAFTNMIVCILAGFIGNSILKQKMIMPVMTCFALSILKGIMVFVILYIGKVYSSFGNVFIIGIYSLIISIVMYKGVYRLCQKPYMERRWRF
ncbi:rod shape-determining protein MreD [Clostridium fermenticellae]|uniref:Rod shape-determining protein MreD n=1 Tax=Clostridium fermenticellae TaxID=2068654 RepID=A0A386H2W4_9CLOT|nr:rod shape-determining protein MreD [Clostridium fermenticellae]AYD39883.1 rod shape-determining protein MreD [Clostridium fermenticellae]